MTSPLYDAHQTHLAALRRQRRAPNTLKVYAIYCGGYVEFLRARGLVEPILNDLTPALVGEYQDHIRAHSLGSRGGAVAENQAVRLLKAWATWLWRREYYPTDPLARLDPPRLAKLHRSPFSELEVRALLDAARMGPNPVMERALLLLGLDTGARIGELVGAWVDDLNLDAGVILFRKTKNGRPRRVFFGISGRADGGPCVVALRQWLVARPLSEALNLFLSPDGWPLSAERARRLYHALGESAGVPQCFPHRSRHTAASEFLAALPGAELHLRHRLGHLSAEVLSDYISISDASAAHVAETASISAKWDL